METGRIFTKKMEGVVKVDSIVDYSLFNNSLRFEKEVMTGNFLDGSKRVFLFSVTLPNGKVNGIYVPRFYQLHIAYEQCIKHLRKVGFEQFCIDVEKEGLSFVG